MTQQPRNEARKSSARSAAIVLGLAAAMLAGAALPADAAAVKAISLGIFTRPVYVAFEPSHPHLLFVVEQTGAIQVLSDEHRLAHPFLDISDLVLATPDVGAGGEQGLLSVAFPLDYAMSGHFYVDFTNMRGDIEVDEFRRYAAAPTQAVRASRRILLTIPHRGAQNHNGGQLQFGPDGYLYISTGDGGALSPPGEPARDINSLLGKILRIDPHRTVSRPYGIPASNPFVGRLGRDEIYAFGLRNPWRFSFDGVRLAIGDVGETRIEEVDFLTPLRAAGANLGWPQYEGRLVFDAARPGPGRPVFPMFVYGHSGGRCAIVGGYVVHDPSLPTLVNRYLYGDLCTGELRDFYPAIDRAPQLLGDRPVGVVLPGLTSFGRGFAGRIYTAQIGGTVSRLAPGP